MPLTRGGVYVLRNSSTAGIRPNKVLWAGTEGTAGYGLDPTLSPNPGTTNIRLLYLNPGVPTGGQAVQGYRLYRNGNVVATLAADKFNPGLSGLTAGGSNDWQVAAYNDQGEGEKSDILTIVQATASQVAPNPPTGGTVSGTPTSSSATVSYTASTTAGVSYNIYVNGESSPSYTTVSTSQLVTGLAAGQDNSVLVKSVLSGVESTTGVTIIVTTSADTSTIQLAAADAFVDTMYGQAKVGYGVGVHDWGTPANKTAIQNYYKEWGLRSYRDALPNNSGQKTAHLDFLKAVHPVTGVKFQANIGSVHWQGLYRIDSYTEQEVYAAAYEDVTASLSWLAESVLTDATLGIDDLAEVITGIGGPNEVNDGNGAVTPNWARNARIYAETIWNLMRQGKLWNGVYTRTVAATAAGKQYYNYSVSTPGTFVTPTGAKAKFANYPTIFANVPIFAPSTRFEFTAAQAIELGGSLIAGATGRLAGKRELARWTEIANPHQYQQGEVASEQRLKDSASKWDDLVPNSGYTASRPWEGTVQFTEGGYNHMGFQPNGAPTTEGRGAGQTYSPDGSFKCPPWVMAVYIPILYATCFKLGYKFHLFEMMDDDDTPTASTRTYNIQAYFGHVWTPNNDPTTWTPLASFNAIRRMTNLLEDRVDPAVPNAAFPLTRRPMTVTARNGVNIVELTKQNGDTFYLVWRAGVNIFKDELKQTNPRICYINGQGAEVRGLPPDVNVTFRLDHTTGSGTRQVDIFRPNKARWINAGVANPTAAQASDTRSVGHDDVTTWAGTNPTPDTVVGAIGPGGSFTFAVPYDLVIVRVKG